MKANLPKINIDIPKNATEYLVDENDLYRFLIKLLVVIPFSLTALFIMFYPFSFLRDGLSFLLHLIFWLIPIIIVHEGLHAFVWGILSWKWKNIRFGFNRQYLTFYTSCSQPLKKNIYFLGGITPFIALALVPCIYGFLQAKFYWVAFSIFNALTCTADLYMCFLLLQVPSRVLILDHPEKLGFYIISSKQ